METWDVALSKARLEGTDIESIEHHITCKNGAVRNIVISGITIEDNFLATFHDVTEHRRAEEALRGTNEYLDSLFNYANAPIVVWDPQFKITRFNCASESLTGRKASDVLDQSLEILFPADRVEDSMKLIRKTLEGERLETVEIDIQHLDGPVRAVLWNSATLFTPDGKTPVATIAQGTDITDRKRAEDALRQRDRDLQERNAELTRFTYAVSHDLKSPLVTIKTFLGYLEQDIRGQDAEGVKKDMNYIRTAADKMARLLDELLDLSRVGRKVNPPEETPLKAIVKEAMDLVAGQIAERGVKVEVTEEPVILHGDRMRLVEVFQNLLDNACKFMGDQAAPRVEIGVEKSGGETVFFVRDNGLGIDPRYQSKLFGLFEKLDPSTAGTGIGLALVRRIVKVHGGRIWMESEGIGKGATFRFTLGGKENHGLHSHET
jgi:PAS domain S-box-containing protein